MTYTDEQKLIRRYLLGDLDEERRQTFEERFITDPDFKAQVLLLEDEMVEEYAIGRLSGEERERVEARLLTTPEQRLKMQVVRTLSGYAAGRAPEADAPVATSPARSRVGFKFSLWPKRWRVGAVAAGLLLVVAACVLLLTRDGTRPTADADARRAEIEREVARLNARDAALPPDSVTPLTLTPEMVRGAGETSKVSNPASVIQFRLKLPAATYKGYRAEVFTSESVKLFGYGGLSVAGGEDAKEILLNVPSSSLPAGDYQLRLSGLSEDGKYEDVAEYSFRVIKN